jgi:non-ribosomal peptide synthetase component F
VTLDAYSHQDLPFDKLAEELQTGRDMSRAPVFQNVFVLQNVPGATFDFPGLSVTPLKLERHTSHFDLTMTMEYGAAGLTGSLEYNLDVYDRPLIQKFVGHFKVLLEEFAARPELRLLEVPLDDGGPGPEGDAADSLKGFRDDQFVFELG